jgi:hypothetical protein
MPTLFSVWRQVLQDAGGALEVVGAPVEERQGLNLGSEPVEPGGGQSG